MPLSPLPASNTKRYFIGQQAGGLHHEIQVRVSDAVNDLAALSVFQFAFALLQDDMYADCSFDSLSVAENGSDIRNPVAGWTTIVGTAAIGNQPDNDEPLTLGLRGRSADGRKVRMFLWGMVFTRTTSWFLVPDPSSPTGEFLAQLNTSPNIYLSISGAQPVWEQNCTINYNDAAIKNERP